MMKRMWKIWISFCLAAAMLCGTWGSTTAYGASGYLKSVTYFGDEWPANFWNSEMDHLNEDMMKIRNDGFNSVILVIPWREFQPETKPVSYNEYALAKLDEVMNAAAAQGLMVSLRLGYTWDYHPVGESMVARAERLLYNEDVRKAWLDFASVIYQRAAAHGNFFGGFMTWEDFWDFTYTVRRMNRLQRETKASQIGYQAYLERTHSLEEVNRLYGDSYGGFDRVPLPEVSQPAMRLFYEFYDQFLNDLLAQTQQVFPGLSMEVRTDAEYLKKEDGSYSYFGHEITYGCGAAPYASVMYSVPQGQINDHEKLSAAAGIQSAARQLDRVLQYTGGKKLYVDQFLFYDNTPGYEHNAQIVPEELGAYLTGMAPVLRARTVGYGIWTYRNYGNNAVYNPQFALGQKGWNFDGGCRVEERNGSNMARIEPGEQIKQGISSRMSHRENGGAYLRFTAETESGQPTTLEVMVGSAVRYIEVSGREDFFFELHPSRNVDISFRASGKEAVYVDNVKVYGYEQQGLLYDMNGNPLACAGAVRMLNANLP